MKRCKMDLSTMSVVLVNVDLDIPDWRGIRKQIDERKRSKHRL
jgi:hypothetical protein